MTPAMLARASGLTQAYISELRSGRKQTLTESSAEKLASALGGSVSWLISGEGVMQRPVGALPPVAAGSLDVGTSTAPSTSGIEQMQLPCLAAALEMAAAKLASATDPTIRAALAGYIERLAHELAGREMQRIAAGHPDHL